MGVASQLSSQPNPASAQREASDPTASLWVNASAGSGKTKVLTDRVVRLLLSGVRPEKILCLTYTKAGAAQMANRITTLLSKWAVCDDNALRRDFDDLQNQPPSSRQLTEARRLFARVLSCPGGLRICTIHSFCQEILSRFPIEAGLPPYFAIIDDQELISLSDEVLKDILREAEKNPEQELGKALHILISAQGEAGFNKTVKEIMSERVDLAAALARAGSEQNLIAQIRTFLHLKPEESAKNFRAQAMEQWPLDDLKNLVHWWSEGGKTYVKNSKILKTIMETPEANRADWFDKYCLLFLTKENKEREAADKKTPAKYPDMMRLAAEETSRLLTILERIEAAEIAELTASMVIFSNIFIKRLKMRKAAHAVLDYDDLIVFTENLLSRAAMAPWISYKLDKGIDHILLDEAQDTSRAQWNIVRALTEEFFAGLGSKEGQPRTLFVVGDEKQSIFSFQNADPQAFFSFRDYFADRMAEAGQTLKEVSLRTSFRSAPAILKSVDAIFAQAIARKGVAENPVAHLHTPNRDNQNSAGRVEVWPLMQEEREKIKNDGDWVLPTEYEEEGDPEAELTEKIAQKIKYWLTHKEILPGTSDPIKPQDIMILLRRRGRFADLMVRALKAKRIPVTGVDRMHLIDQLAVMDLLAVIRFVLLPEDDLNLATLLRSPLLGLSEEQLMNLAIGRKESLWQSLKHSPHFATMSDYLSDKLAAADFSTPFAFISEILNMPCPANTLSGRKALWTRLGDESLDPIEELLNEAQKFGHSHSPSLQNFLQWLTRSNREIKRELDHGDHQDDGQVRIMTVHASKGLEAPIVILPDTVSLPRTADISKIQWNDADIPLFLRHTPAFGATQPLWQKARHKQMEEYRRLFYVALTRTANRLYICGWQNRKSETEKELSWYNLALTALQPLHQDCWPQDAPDLMPQVIFADPLTVSAPKNPVKTTEAKIPLPEWVFQKIATPAPDLIPPPSKLSQDTSAAATPDILFARGRLIHRLLQTLPDIEPSGRLEAMERFLASPRTRLSAAERREIANEVNKLLSDERFEILFGRDSFAEVPLTGVLDGRNVFRQIDRVCIYNDEVWIVDYKTNRPPPKNVGSIPLPYRQQLEEYRELLSHIYPNKRVRCFLLWTYAPALMEVPV